MATIPAVMSCSICGRAMPNLTPRTLYGFAVCPDDYQKFMVKRSFAHVIDIFFYSIFFAIVFWGFLIAAAILVVLGIGVFVAMGSLYTVSEVEQVIITEFGKPPKEPGLHEVLDLIESQPDVEFAEFTLFQSTTAYKDKDSAEGKDIFRFDSFGDEDFWSGLLHLDKAIAGAANGGVGGGVSPATALSVGLKVDADALPAAVIGRALCENRISCQGLWRVCEAGNYPYTAKV